MKKRLSLKIRVLSLVMMLAMAFNVCAVPTVAITSELFEPPDQKEAAAQGSAGGESNETVKDIVPVKDSEHDLLDEIEIPSQNRNPYEIDFYDKEYPVYNQNSFRSFTGDDDVMTTYGVHKINEEGRSPYYTAAITPWFSYETEDEFDGFSVEGKLPYIEGRKNMLHSDLTLKNGIISVSMLADYDVQSIKNVFSDLVKKEYNLNPEQVFVVISAKLLSGSGGIRFSDNTGGARYSKYATVENGEAIEISLEVPLSVIDKYSVFYFECGKNANGKTDSMMTDFYVTLLDDTMPTVQSITSRIEIKEDDMADIVLEMKFNEGLKFVEPNVIDESDNTEVWVEVLLLDLISEEKHKVKLYLEKLDSSGTITFRRNIGRYHYRNFRIVEIVNSDFVSSVRQDFRYMIDLADEYYVSAYEKIDYGNALMKTDDSYPNEYTAYLYTSAISDYAGNPINEATVNGWKFGDQTYIKNSFEATEVRLYNEITLAKTQLVSGTEGKTEAEISDQFVGPTRTITAYIYLDQFLTKEEAETIEITFNINNPDGTPLKASPTAYTIEETDEVYTNGTTKRAVVKFENIKITEGMTFAGEENDSRLKIIDMDADIEGKTPYPHLPNSVTDIYVDFSKPVITVDKYAVYSNTEDDGKVEGDKSNYKISFSIGVEDKADYERIANLLGSKMFVYINGEVEKDTAVKYLFSDNPTPPETVDGYTNSGYVSKDGRLYVGSVTLLNNYTEMYLHLCFETDGIYLDGLNIFVSVEDAVGNSTENDVPISVEYLIDEIAPTVQEEYRRAEVIDNNQAVKAYFGFSASDTNDVTEVKYAWGTDPSAVPEEWSVATITQGSNPTFEVTREFGGITEDEGANKVYEEVLWIKAIDEFSNESEPMAIYFAISLAKPQTNVKFEGDINALSNSHKLTVTGPEKSVFDGSDAYTRVTVTPVDNSEYSYVTLVKSGEAINPLSFEGLTWYRVVIKDGIYTEVSEAIELGENYVLSESDIMYGLLSCYGEVRIEFENGYGNMLPVEGERLYDAPNVGSYMDDPNYFVIRIAAPYVENHTVHNVDFGAIIDRDDKVVVANADKGASPYRYNASKRGVNPMRNTQIHFSISNILKSEYGLLDFDYQSSYAEFFRVGADGESDVLMAKQEGLGATANQYFIINNFDDEGEAYISGAYYLRVTVKSNSGHSNVYESSRLVLDAETADNAGVWKYDRQSYTSLESIKSGSYEFERFSSEGTPFESFGVALTPGGETSRNRIFATYSYGVTALIMFFETPGTQKTFEGISVGNVEGFRVWNLLSNPSDTELNEAAFRKDRNAEYLTVGPDLDAIYTEDAIPQGKAGLDNLYLVKGANVICYQIKLENGYVSPIKQFTIFVSDYLPELNVAIENYVPSHEPSTIEGMINVDNIRFFIESAYSLNGSGKVSIDVLSDYDMKVGIGNGEGFDEILLPDPTPYQSGKVGSLAGELPEGKSFKTGDYVYITQDSYTADFPYDNDLCTAAFYVRDEYGGTTIIAPQIGEHRRLETPGNEYNYEEYNISYMGRYYDDPFIVDDSFTSWRKEYNRIERFGAKIIGLKSYLIKNTEDGEIDFELISEDPNVELEYNLFNIETNDIYFGSASRTTSKDGRSAGHIFQGGNNFDLIYWDNATITVSGGFLEEGESVKLPLSPSGANKVGYMGASVWYYDDEQVLSLNFAAPSSNATVSADTEITWDYEIECFNKYGESFKYKNDVTIKYINYIQTPGMNEKGAVLEFTYPTVEYGNQLRLGKYSKGESSEVSVTDYFGNEIGIICMVEEDFDEGTKISYSTVEKTAKPVVIEISRADTPITVDIIDHEIMSVEMSDDSKTATVTVSANTKFTYRYMKGDEEVMVTLEVDNVSKPSPIVVWDADLSKFVETDEGERFRYGEVTVYLGDANFVLRDRYTGKQPTFTFAPGGQDAYIFKKDDIVAILGDEEVALEEDILITLDIELREIPDPLGLNSEDTETPNVQVLAYTNKNGVYAETKLAIQLESVRNSTALNDYKNYKIFNFVGERANASEMLKFVGWSESYRFEIETVDSSRVRIFIKEGLYAEAPDYETGYSDSIEGVELNSKLLTVNKNAKFTIFVVDAKNNASCVAFDIQNLGSAPIPEIVKVVVDNETVRGYIIPPEGVESFTVVGNPDVKKDLTEGSKYYNLNYVDYKENESYIVNYTMTYNGVEVRGSVDVSVSEINLRELAMIGNIEWSANKTLEATAQDITAVATFNGEIDEIRTLGEYDASKVKFIVTGNILTLVYSDNHPAIEIRCYASNGSSVTARFDEVNNVDRSAPVIKEVSRELSDDGKYLTLTLSANERALFKEGGYIGEAVKDENGETLYYYTRTIVENGVYTYSFSDMSGLISTIDIEVSEIVDAALAVSYSLSLDGANSKDDPAELDVTIGDKIFIKPNRSVSAKLSGVGEFEIKAGAWSQIEVPKILGGLQPYLEYVDEYGNVLIHQFSKIKVPDTQPPDIIVDKKTYSVRVGTERADIEANLLKNVSAFDDSGEAVTLAVKFTENTDVIGVTEVEYLATDSAGNTASVKEKLRITSIYEPIVYCGEEKLSRGDGIIVKANEELVFKIDCNGVAYRVLYKAGIRTEAQLKDGSTVVTDYAKADTVSLGVLEKGIYTVCIQTQERDYFTIRISVE